MPLATGVHLGPYEIVSLLGAGGMGEVYEARDTRLDRTVAVKVLPPDHAEAPEFRERFEREARSISALSHPNICTLYDVGVTRPEGGRDGAGAAASGPVSFLVMEHLEGETLAARLTRGALPLAEALELACEVASALDAAHRQGIVHRDLKPGNVMLTRAGSKLLDFGLAKVGSTSPASAASAVKTMTAPLTARGTILGTFQYMAPEQIEGDEADARTDIFAFGAMLFEMLTGRKAFQGKSQASLLGAILKDEPPDVSRLQALTPPALDYVVRTCLAKDPGDRFQTMHDLLLQLRWIGQGGSAVGVPAPVLAHRRRRERWAWIAFGAVASLWVLTLVPAVRWFLETPDDRQVQFVVDTPGAGLNGVVSLSPDGRLLAFTAPDASGTARLWVRRLDTTDAQPLPGVGFVTWAFWSPDSRHLAFGEEGRLRRVDTTGGSPQTVCTLPAGLAGGTWNTDGIILFASAGTLYRVVAAGGEPAEVAKPDLSGHSGYYFPVFLPGGRHFLFAARGSDSAHNGIWAGTLDGTPPTFVAEADSMPVFVEPGFLMFVREAALFMRPFDANALRLTGEPIQLAADMVVAFSTGRSPFTASASGMVAYRSGETPNVDLMWFDRQGRALRTAGEPGRFTAVNLSPDERLIAAARVDPRTRERDLWTIDVSTNIMSRLTSPDIRGDIVWRHDSKAVAFWSRRTGKTSFYQQTVGVGQDVLLYEPPEDQTWPDDWSADGRFFLFHRGGQLFSLALDDQDVRLVGESLPLIDEAHFSPDGRWVAYGSDRSGAWEVYVAPFPAFDNQRKVSNGGGGQAHWRGDGRELFYLSQTGAVMSVLVTPVPGTGELEFEPPTTLFQSPFAAPTMVSDTWDVTADGRQFLFTQRQRPAADAVPITVLINWMARFRQ